MVTVPFLLLFRFEACQLNQRCMVHVRRSFWSCWTCPCCAVSPMHLQRCSFRSCWTSSQWPPLAVPHTVHSIFGCAWRQRALVHLTVGWCRRSVDGRIAFISLRFVCPFAAVWRSACVSSAISRLYMISFLFFLICFGGLAVCVSSACPRLLVAFPSFSASFPASLSSPFSIHFLHYNRGLPLTLSLEP
jgi:hypothetical protein